jgi:hypothetical protein
MPTIWTRKGRLSAADIQNRRSSAAELGALRALLGLPVADRRYGVAVKPALAMAATIAAGSARPGV